MPGGKIGRARGGANRGGPTFAADRSRLRIYRAGRGDRKRAPEQHDRGRHQRAAPEPDYQGNEEETEKRLAGLLMRGDDVICLDNCTEPLGGQKLLSVLTEEIAGLRPLGSSHLVDCQTNSLFLMNGNNLTMLGDMCRRVLVCTIDPGVELPERRTFAFNPQEMASRDRGRYVAACLTILMAYRAVGMPRQAVPLGSYGEWSRQVRDALLWLGEPDPCLTIDASKANDPIAEKITAVFHHWAEVIGEGARATVKDVIAAAGKASMEGHSGLSDALHDIAAPMVRGVPMHGLTLAASEIG